MYVLLPNIGAGLNGQPCPLSYTEEVVVGLTRFSGHKKCRDEVH
jgi:hypothetical protein